MSESQQMFIFLNKGSMTTPQEVEQQEQERIVGTQFERYPGKRSQILNLPFDQQDEARRFYIHYYKLSF